MDKPNKIALITGASSGIGLEVAIKLIKLGYTVYGAARRTELMKPIQDFGGHIISLDLCNSDSINQAVEAILKQEGHIDVLVNNAGYGLGGSIESVSMEDAKKQFAVNVFGLAQITQLVLPSMREQKKGRIINVSSIAGFFSTPFMGWYHASKYSVEALSDALRLEVESFGIKVSIIEPGLIQTDWGKIAAENIKKSEEGTPYELNGKNSARFYEKNYCSGKKLTSPSVVADTIVKAILSKNPKARYQVGKNSRLFVNLSKICSTNSLDFFKRKIYGIIGE